MLDSSVRLISFLMRLNQGDGLCGASFRLHMRVEKALNDLALDGME